MCGARLGLKIGLVSGGGCVRFSAFLAGSGGIWGVFCGFAVVAVARSSARLGLKIECVCGGGSVRFSAFLAGSGGIWGCFLRVRCGGGRPFIRAPRPEN